MNWKPIVKNEGQKKEIENRLTQIKNDLIKNLDLQPVLSFFFGNLSGSIFLMQWAKHFPNDRDAVQPHIDYLTQNSIEQLNNSSEFSFSYLVGLGGIAWAFNELKQNGFLPEDIEETLVQLDGFIISQAERNISNRNNDLFYGAFGDLNYLINRYRGKKIEESTIVGLIDQLTDQLFISPNGLVGNYREKELNLGFAHGIAPYFVLMNRLASINPNLKAKYYSNFNQMRAFIAQFKQDESCSFTYPNIIEKEKIIEYSPIRWCHGELSIVLSFAMGAYIFDDQELKKEAISIGLKTVDRRDLAETEISEFGMCHGAVGNGHLYARLYNYTGINDFKDTGAYWIDQGLKMANYPDGLANYKVVNSNNQAVNSINFLNGISGLGLSYLAAISDNISPNWDNAIMLS